MKPTYYVTTPIYYPSDFLHIGNSYTTVAADVIARYKKFRGFDVMFLTGTDEHGQKIERKAKETGVEPIEYVDKIVAWIKELWKTMDIEYDYYIRTTDKQHITAVQKIFKRLYDQGDIYKGTYEGWYCTPDETFFTERQLVNGKCPDCGRDVELVKEESYFLKLSKYQERLTKHIEENPDFILPVSRKNEMINNFIKPGLEDLCVSRTSISWGIPVDFDPGHVVYVWIDALSNYITALGYSADETNFKKYWPADVHLVGKEIIRFHTIIWPIILMALDLPLPKQIFGNGWLTKDGQKIGKSMGNAIDPKILVERFGVDAVRYFLMREFTFGQDGNYTNESLMQRINSDLANDLGNLLSRTVGMIDRYFGGRLPKEQFPSAYEREVARTAKNVVEKTEHYMDKFAFSDALIEIWTLISRANKFIDETAPWNMIKDETKTAEVAGVLYALSEVLRIVAVLIAPVMPNTPGSIYKQLNITDKNLMTWDSVLTFGLLGKEVVITKGDIVFPRIDIKKELAEWAAEIPKIVEKTELPKKAEPVMKVELVKEAEINVVKEINIDDFAKIELKTGLVLQSERVRGSDKLLKSQIRIGAETRQIVSGIAQHYSPEQLVGKTVVVVTNLKPVKLRGEMSYGMILAATSNDGSLKLVMVDGNISDGACVK